jgi:hypothetical protein
LQSRSCEKTFLPKSHTILGWLEMYPLVSKTSQDASNEEIPERERLQNRQVGFFHSFRIKPEGVAHPQSCQRIQVIHTPGSVVWERHWYGGVGGWHENKETLAGINGTAEDGFPNNTGGSVVGETLAVFRGRKGSDSVAKLFGA